MKLNRKWMAAGLVVTGLTTGTLATGGVALASARGTPGPASAAITMTASPPPMTASPPPMTASPPPMTASAAPTPKCSGSAGKSAMRSVLTTAAAYLGLTQDQLRTQLKAGKSLAQVARERGKPVSGLKDAILADITNRINADHKLTPGQKQAMLRKVQSHLDGLINATWKR